VSLSTDAVEQRARSLTPDELPAYAYDLEHLRSHTASVRAALPPGLELYYAAKANAEPEVLRTLAEYVDGFDVSSGGELLHVRECVPDRALAFSGPGKSHAEIASALAAGVDRVHVESLHELAVIDSLAERRVDVLLRVNLPVRDGLLAGQSLTMGGSPSPFGMEPVAASEAVRRVLAGELSRIRVRGVHAHLASGLDAAQQVALARSIVGQSVALFASCGAELHEINVGGGMNVDYADPAGRFDWSAYGAGMEQLLAENPSVTVRIEPGRAITAYSGWYVTDVVDVKASHGRDFAVLRGGTHHLRTPATKGHDQPCIVLPVGGWVHPWERPSVTSGRVDLVGQLCTPKDLLARDVTIPDGLRGGDRVVFAMAGAYAWNISHHDFLMHPRPSFHFLGGGGSR
jgi:diaminopimelate decarboxylase